LIAKDVSGVTGGILKFFRVFLVKSMQHFKSIKNQNLFAQKTSNTDIASSESS